MMMVVEVCGRGLARSNVTGNQNRSWREHGSTQTLILREGAENRNESCGSGGRNSNHSITTLRSDLGPSL